MKASNPENGLKEGSEFANQASTKESAVQDDAIGAHMEEFEAIQNELLKLDEQCAKEQMMIQKRYDEEKKPWFDKRQAIIEKIPGFWCRIFQNHPALHTINEDINILQHLKKIDLDDNLDDNGSYTVSFVFDEGAKEYMEPLTLVKHVKFENNEEIVPDCTEIIWKENKNPIEAAKKRSEKKKSRKEWSLFEWFTKNSLEDKPDLGELIRRDIWHTPLAYITDRDRDDYEEDYDDEDDEDENDEDNEYENFNDENYTENFNEDNDENYTENFNEDNDENYTENFTRNNNNNSDNDDEKNYQYKRQKKKD